jgi:predicted RNase H-like HicB family nuclease
LPGDGSWYCEIPELPGVWANADTEAEAREDLRQALEGWIRLRLRMQQSIPAVDAVTISFTRVT